MLKNVWLAAAIGILAIGCGGVGEGDPAGSATRPVGGPAAPSFSHAGGNKVFGVMTRNLYPGADFDPVILAIASGGNPIPATSAAWGTIQATDFPTRAIAIADEVAAAQPHLIALNEVFTFWYGPADSVVGGTSPAQIVVYDFLQILADELDARGLKYVVASEHTNTEMEAPVIDTARGVPSSNYLIDVRLRDRDVILARHDLSTANASGATFSTLVSAPVIGDIKRGWTSVDVKFRGEWFRFVDAHPEPQSAGAGYFNTAQLTELAGVLAGSPLPVVLAGDLNATAAGPGGAGSAAYQHVIAVGGFSDAWFELYPSIAGLTCCQAEDLSNAASILYERIDLVLFRGPFTALSATLYGEDPADRIGGLWPSDHAGLFTELRITDEKFADAD